MVDRHDNGKKAGRDPYQPLNARKIPDQQTAVAISDADDDYDTPRIRAAGRGKIAEEIVRLAFENDVRVRSDEALANMLASVEIDSPIPSEAFMAVAEVLSYVYRANMADNPYDWVY
jgi:flagellar biosynthesis protein